MKNVLKNYGFIIFMLIGIVAGCVVGAFFPAVRDAEGAMVDPGATVLEPLGTLFINMMFCIVVPMVFCSIASAIANMDNAKRAGKVMGATVATFCVTAAIAALIMYVVCRIIPLVPESYQAIQGEVDDPMSLGEMVIGFFTKPDFNELLSRRAILPLIVFAVLFGFGVQMSGGKETPVAKFLASATDALMNMVKLGRFFDRFSFLILLKSRLGACLLGEIFDD